MRIPNKTPHYLFASSSPPVRHATNKLLFDEDKIEKVLSKLSDLTQEESAMALAELAASRDGESISSEGIHNQ